MNKLLSTLIAAAFAGMTFTAVAADAPPAADAKPATEMSKPADDAKPMKKHHHKKHKKTEAAPAADAKPAEATPAK